MSLGFLLRAKAYVLLFIDTLQHDKNDINNNTSGQQKKTTKRKKQEREREREREQRHKVATRPQRNTKQTFRDAVCR